MKKTLFALSVLFSIPCALAAQQVTYPVTFAGSDPLATGYVLVTTETQPVDANSDGKADSVVSPTERIKTPNLTTTTGSLVLTPGKVYWAVAALYNQFGNGPWGNFVRLDTRVPGASPTITIGAGTVANLSTRGRVGNGEAVMISGIVIKDHTTGVLLRGVGPTLSNFNIVEPLQDPMIELINQATGARVAFNDNWEASEPLAAASNSVSAFPLPENSKDAILLVQLEPGQYTLICRGRDGGEGVALLEAYRL